MRPERLRECLSTIMWDEFILTKALKENLLTVYGWTGGSREIPADVAKWMEKLAKAFETAAKHKPVRKEELQEEVSAEAAQ